MLETFTIDTFSGLVGATFTVAHGAGESVATLVSAKATGKGRSEEARDPFSLLFSIAGGDVLLQGTYGFSTETLGAFDLFVVPVERTADAVTYEAVFT